MRRLRKRNRRTGPPATPEEFLIKLLLLIVVLIIVAGCLVGCVICGDSKQKSDSVIKKDAETAVFIDRGPPDKESHGD